MSVIKRYEKYVCYVVYSRRNATGILTCRALCRAMLPYDNSTVSISSRSLATHPYDITILLSHTDDLLTPPYVHHVRTEELISRNSPNSISKSLSHTDDLLTYPSVAPYDYQLNTYWGPDKMADISHSQTTFSMHFLEWKYMNFTENFTEAFS